MKYCFVINPAAGKGKAVEQLSEEICRVCEEQGVDYFLYLTQAPRDLIGYIHNTVSADPDAEYRFYVGGGDGTLCEAAEGVMALPEQWRSRVCIGLIPKGTGNDYVRNFSPASLFFDVAAQLRAKETAVDLVACNEHISINMINIGFDCEVVRKTADLKKRAWIPSGFAYIAGVVATLFRKPGVEANIAIGDGQGEERRLLLTTFAKGQFCGGGFHSNPRSSIDDGKIDLLFIRNVTRRTFVRLIGAYKKGAHLCDRYADIVHHEKADEVRMTFSRPTYVSVDGELIIAESLHMRVLHGALQFLIPEGATAEKSKCCEADEVTV